MKNNLLQSLLQAGLLDIGDSDERLANIEKSIADVEAKLKKEQSLLPAYTLVGLDPNINPDEPVLAEVEAIIATHWKALRAKFPETPVPIIRAVILHALYNIGIADVKIASIVYLTATNFYPYAKLGREKDVAEKIISDLGELAEKNASEEWSLTEASLDLKIPTLKISSGLKVGEILIDPKALKASLKVASGNSPEGYQPYHHPNEWSTHFSNKASDGISSFVKETFGQLEQAFETSSIDTSINKFFTEFKKSLDQTLKSSFTSIQAIERRSKLLWWKETLYSSSLKDSYRSVDETVQPIIMAYDLYQQLPAIVPVSVDYLLRDTLLLLNDKANEKTKFSKLLEEMFKDDGKNNMKEYFKDIDVPNKRISITDFLTLLTHGKVEPSSLKSYTGIDSNEEVSLADIAVMILHDLMSEYLIPKSK